MSVEVWRNPNLLRCKCDTAQICGSVETAPPERFQTMTEGSRLRLELGANKVQCRAIEADRQRLTIVARAWMASEVWKGNAP